MEIIGLTRINEKCMKISEKPQGKLLIYLCKRWDNIKEKYQISNL